MQLGWDGLYKINLFVFGLCVCVRWIIPFLDRCKGARIFLVWFACFLRDPGTWDTGSQSHKGDSSDGVPKTQGAADV